MTLQQFEYIIALDDYRHYVTAAEHCFVSQPNLTMQVKKLEDEFGIRIFDRDKKPLQPTKIGKEVIARARQILRDSQQLKEFVTQEIGSIEGEYTIGIIPTLAPYLLPFLLPVFIKENPNVHLKIKELQTEQLIAQLEKGTLDIGLLVTPLKETSIREIPVFNEPFLLYLPENHKLLNEKLMLADDLDPSEVLVLDEGHCFREQALSICNRKGLGSSIGFDFQSGSIEALKSLVKNGVGFTLVPELSVIHELDSVHIKRFSKPEPVREVSIVVHSNYFKESVLMRLKETIQKVIPQRLLEEDKVVKIDWR